MSVASHVCHQSMDKEDKKKAKLFQGDAQTVIYTHENPTDNQEKACEQPVASSETWNKKGHSKLLLYTGRLFLNIFVDSFLFFVSPILMHLSPWEARDADYHLMELQV